MRQRGRPRTRGERQGRPARVRAPHRGAVDGSPGRSPFSSQPRRLAVLPIHTRGRRDGPNDSLPASLDGHMLNSDRLLSSTSAQPSKRLELCRERPQQLRAEVSIPVHEVDTISVRRPTKHHHAEVVAAGHLRGEEPFEFGSRADRSEEGADRVASSRKTLVFHRRGGLSQQDVACVLIRRSDCRRRTSCTGCSWTA